MDLKTYLKYLLYTILITGVVFGSLIGLYYIWGAYATIIGFFVYLILGVGYVWCNIKMK